MPQYCLRGKAFPRGELDPDTAVRVKADVLAFLQAEPGGSLPDSVARMLLASSTAGGALPVLDRIPGPFPRIQVRQLGCAVKGKGVCGRCVCQGFGPRCCMTMVGSASVCV